MTIQYLLLTGSLIEFSSENVKHRVFGGQVKCPELKSFALK